MSSVKTVADSNVIGGSQMFDCDKEMEKQITAKTKSENEQFTEMMDRCIARWDNGKSIKVAELRSQSLQEIVSSESEDDAVFCYDGFWPMTSASSIAMMKTISFCMDEDVFLPNICDLPSESKSFESTLKKKN